MRYVCAVFLVLLIACGQPPRMVTMDGRDGATIVDPINLWDNYRARGRITGRARHGEAASLLRQDGAGCEVRTASGQQGWVTCANFIREFK